MLSFVIVDCSCYSFRVVRRCCLLLVLIGVVVVVICCLFVSLFVSPRAIVPRPPAPDRVEWG